MVDKARRITVYLEVKVLKYIELFKADYTLPKLYQKGIFDTFIFSILSHKLNRLMQSPIRLSYTNLLTAVAALSFHRSVTDDHFQLQPFDLIGFFFML